MGKKIQALKETFPREWPKFSMPKISRPKLSDLRLSDDEQLAIWAAIWLVCTLLGASLVTELSLILITIGMLGFSWFVSAVQKLRLNDWKLQMNNLK